jgi:hypothetical protein
VEPPAGERVDLEVREFHIALARSSFKKPRLRVAADVRRRNLLENQAFDPPRYLGSYFLNGL